MRLQLLLLLLFISLSTLGQIDTISEMTPIERLPVKTVISEARMGAPEDVSGPKIKNSGKNILDSSETLLSIYILGMGVVIAIGQFCVFLFRRDVSFDQFMTMFLMTLVILGSLYIVTSGTKSSQIGAPLGLFGTIAGYLLGKKTNSKKKKNIT